MNYNEIVVKANEIEISPRDTEKLVFLLAERGEQKQLDIQKELGLPSSVVNGVLDMFPDFVVPNGDRISLNPDSKNFVSDLRALRTERDDLVRAKLDETRKYLEDIDPKRPECKRKLDQFRATPQSVVDRAYFLYERGELEGRDIFLMGDNDLISIAIASTGLAGNVGVFDIDRDVLNEIHNIRDERGLKIKTSKLDARNPLYEDSVRKYDVAITDPPYTPEGIKLFVTRCIEAIGRKNGAVLISYGYSQRSRERALPVQDALTKLGLVIEEVRPGFNRYYAAQAIGCQSSLYLCRISPRTPKVKPTARQLERFDGEETEDNPDGYGVYTFRHPNRR